MIFPSQRRYNSALLQHNLYSSTYLWLCFCLFSFTFLTYNLQGQGNTVISYGQDEGLCGQNYTSSCFDAKGRFWVASLAGGVSRYDGTNWKCYFTQDGLTHNTSYNIIADKYGYVFVDHNEFGISLFQNDHIVQFQTRDIDPLVTEGFEMVNISKKIYLVNVRLKRMYKFDEKTAKFVKINNSLLSQINTTKYWLGGAIFFNSIDTLFVLENDDIGIFSIKLFVKESKEPVQNYKFKNPLIYRTLTSSSKYRIIFQTNDNLILYGKKVTEFQPHNLMINGRKITIKVNQLMAINANPRSDITTAIWSLTENNEYLITDYDISSGDIVRWFKFKSDYRPQAMNKDVAGTYWVLTENNVQRVLPYQLHIPPGSTALKPQSWAAQQARDGNIWFASYQNGFSYYDGWQIHNQPNFLPKNAYFYDGSYTDQNGNMYFNWAGNMDRKVKQGGILQFNGMHRWHSFNIGTNGLIFSPGKNGELLWGTSTKGLWVKPSGKKVEDTASWLKIDSSKSMFLTNIICALEDNMGRYWLGRPSQGMSVYDKSTKTAYNFFKEQNKDMFGLMSIAEDHHGNMWFGTDKGLYFFNNNKKITKNFNFLRYAKLIATETLGNSMVSICKIYNNHSLIIGNMTGYFLLDLDSFYLKKQKISFDGVFRKNNANYLGGQSNQNSVFIDRDSLIWILTSNGAYRHDPRLFTKDTSLLQVVIDSLTIGDKVVRLKRVTDRIELSPTENSLSLYFNHLTNRFLYDNTWYRYRLNDNEWSEVTKNRSVSFQNLESNEYVFQVQAIRNGEFSTVASVKFRIDKPLWRKWWFWLLIIGGASAIGLYLFMKQNEVKKQQIQIAKNRAQVENITREKNKLQVEAIINQLNPHFINNALQWLQVRIDDDEEAVEVVDKLSENISTVFKNSRKKINYHPLRSELKLAENYLYIQKARFGARLHIMIPSKEEVLLLGKYNVPLMIIQIHVENAVEHGIRNKSDGTGMVSISILDKNEYIKISVEDDGVGRSVAQHIGSKGTQNGTRMLNELQKIYNEFNDLKMSQVYEDGIFTDSKGIKNGTRVNILIPKSFNYRI